MFDKEQILLNGNYISGSEVNFYSQNRAFLYGDSIFETIRVNNREILFFEEHLNRLIAGMKVLKYEIPDKFTVFKQKLKEEIIQLLNRNKIFKSARVRITVFRKRGGLYVPETNEIDYAISVKKSKNEKFVLNSSGLLIDVFKDVKKPINIFSPYKTVNSIIYTLAGLYKNEKKLDDCLILNEKDELIESISSNIFLVIDNKLITPPVSSGCIDGIMKNVLIPLAKLSKIICVERTIKEEDLFSADEVFFTNSITGIQWVVAYKNKRYYKKMSDFLIRKLNETVS